MLCRDASDLLFSLLRLDAASDYEGRDACHNDNRSHNNDDRVAGVIRDNTPIKYARTIVSNFSFDVQENLLRFNPTVEHNMFDK